MSDWHPDLAERPGPRYQAIVDALADDIDQGRLDHGTRLPPHRDLAGRLGVTVGTVSRAYKEATLRGLVSGEVGRGTFVKSPVPPSPCDILFGGVDRIGPEVIELGLNFPPPVGEDRLMAESLGALAVDPGLGRLLSYQIRNRSTGHRSAAAAWVARTAGLVDDPERVLITAGTQSALLTVMLHLTQAGDTVLAGEMTYPGLRSLASILHVKTWPVAMDEEGLRPDDLDQAVRASGAQVLFSNPTLQNPTGAIQSEKRRDDIAAIAEKHRLAVVEDDIYGFLVDPHPTAIAARLPDLGYFVTGTSKLMAPSLRIGFLHAPAAAMSALAAIVRTTLHEPSALMMEVVARWLSDGTVEQLTRARQEEARQRNARAREILAPVVPNFPGHPNNYFLWMPLPPHWTMITLVEAARHRRLSLSPSSVFTVGRKQPPAALRVCLGAEGQRERMEQGVQILADLLARPNADAVCVI